MANDSNDEDGYYLGIGNIDQNIAFKEGDPINSLHEAVKEVITCLQTAIMLTVHSASIFSIV